MEDGSYDWMDSDLNIPKGERWSIEIQGDFLKLRRHILNRVPRPTKPRKAVYEFSRKSRFRVLCEISRINWESTMSGCFITLTYPDSCVHWDPRKRNTERYLFWRKLEETTCKKIPLCWRVEWKPRLSGDYVGRVSPHIHLLTFAGGSFSRAFVRRVWSAILGTSKFVQVDVKSVMAGKQLAVYVAKYCAKMDPSCRLDNVPYLNSTGRHWGWLRKDLVPYEMIEADSDLPLAVVKWLRKAVSGRIPWYDLAVDSGFTLIGLKAREVIPKLWHLWLDQEAHGR